jgi:phospholipid/cholesterol/gamma-HCH transport system ATP-binding protein
MVTHDIDALRTICDRIAVLDEGKIIAIGSMSQVLAVDHPYLRSFFRGVRNSPSSAPAIP